MPEVMRIGDIPKESARTEAEEAEFELLGKKFWYSDMVLREPDPSHRGIFYREGHKSAFTSTKEIDRYLELKDRKAKVDYSVFED